MAYDVTLKTKVIGGDVNIFDSEHIRWVRGGVTLDQSKVNPDVTGKKVLKLGEFLGKLTATGKYAPTKHTTLAVAALATDTVLKVSDASRFQAGDAIDVAGTAATIAAGGINTGVAPHEITITAQIGAAKNIGDAVKATDGSGNFDLMLGETVDLAVGDGTFADAVATAFDEARVINARLPRPATDAAKAQLTGIKFV
ncbi:MAG: hypothetical protein ACM3VX_09750 [Bacteroidota bacterium]